MKGEFLSSLIKWCYASFYGSGITYNEPFYIPQIGALWFLLALFWSSIFLKKILDYDKDVRFLIVALLHDFYTNKDLEGNSSVKKLGLHPSYALQNILQYYELNEVQQDIIETHMFPCNIKIPKYKESWLVSGVDKIVGTYEMLRFKISLYAGMYSIFLFELIRIPR